MCCSYNMQVGQSVNFKISLPLLSKYEAESYSDFCFPYLFSGEGSSLQTGSVLVHNLPLPPSAKLSPIENKCSITGRRRNRGGLELPGKVAQKLTCALIVIRQLTWHKKGRKARGTLSEEVFPAPPVLKTHLLLKARILVMHFSPSVLFWHTACNSREFRNFEITAVNSGCPTRMSPNLSSF